VFSKKIPKSLRTSRKSKFREKKCGFPVFEDDAKIQPISENPGKKFPGKSDVFGENFRKSENPENSKSGNFGKKCQNVDFGKFNPRLQSVLKRTF
jgi:hypothetical protein